MDERSNVSSIVLDGFVELVKYKHVYFLFLFVAYVLIVCCNSVVVYVICSQPSLHEAMYVYIAALLLNSVLYSSCIYPKLLLDVLSDPPSVSYTACLFQFVVFYFVGPAEFFLLAAMAYDRYASICRPLQYPTLMTRTRVVLFLAGAWFLPALHSLTAVVLLNGASAKLCSFKIDGIFCNNALYALQCGRSASIAVYGVFAVLDVVLLPIVFIVCTYVKILLVSYRGGGELRRKAAETCLPHLLVLLSLTALSVYDIVIVRIQTDFSKTARLAMTLQIFLYHPLFNPFIYGFKMKEIHKHLKRLLGGKKIT